MEREMEMRRRILRMALQRFLQAGFSRVTTQEIAKALGISKKTLYTYFSSKREILLEALKANLSGMERRLDMVLSEKEAPFERKFVRFLALVGYQIRLVGPVLIEDLFRTVPEAWEIIDTFRRKQVLSRLARLLEEGRQMGRVRADLDLESILFILYSVVSQVLTPDMPLKQGLSLQQVFTSFVELLFGGLLSPESFHTIKDRINEKEAALGQEELYEENTLFID